LEIEGGERMKRIVADAAAPANAAEAAYYPVTRDDFSMEIVDD
jgi:hypothetical protein